MDSLGKLTVGQVNQTSAPALPNQDVQQTSGLLKIRDNITSLKFLVDTGAEFSVLPASTADRARGPHGLELKAANDSNIPTYGRRMLTHSLGLRRNYTWIFLLADVSHPILGADFLSHHDLLVDTKEDASSTITPACHLLAPSLPCHPLISPLLSQPATRLSSACFENSQASLKLHIRQNHSTPSDTTSRRPCSAAHVAWMDLVSP